MERRDAAALVALIFKKRALQRHLLLKHPGAIDRAKRVLLLHDRRAEAGRPVSHRKHPGTTEAIATTGGQDG